MMFVEMCSKVIFIAAVYCIIAYKVDAFNVVVTKSSGQLKQDSEGDLTCTIVDQKALQLNSLTWIHDNDDSFGGGSQIVNYDAVQDNLTYNSSFGDVNSYQMTKPGRNQNPGFSTLTIAAAALQDIGIFFCQVNVAGGFIEIGYTSIDVYVPPVSSVLSTTSSGNFVTDDIVELIEGTAYTFECTTKEVRPAATITWIWDNLPREADKQVNDTNARDNRLFDCTSTLKLTPQFTVHHTKQLDCGAFVPQEPNNIATTNVVLDVKVPPKLSGVYLSDKSGKLTGETEVRVDKGKRHEFTCEVANTRPAATFDWQPTGFLIGSPIRPTDGNVLVNSSQTLTIVNPEIQHHGIQLTCLTNIPTSETLQPVSRSVRIEIWGPPDQPSIDGPIGDMTENQVVTLTCAANNAFPEGEIRWFNNEKDITQDAAENSDNGNGRFNIMSTIIFKPTREDNENTIKCNVSQDSLQYTQEVAVSVEINVKYSSGNVIVSQDPDGPILENQSVTLTCSADANPPANTFKWVKGEQEQVIGDSGTLRLANIKRNETGPYKCRAENTVPPQGVSPAFNITIYYPPENIVLTKSPDDPLTEGQDVTFTCSSEGNPLPSVYTWYKDDIAIPEVNEKTFELKGVSKEQAGNYQCEADNTHFTPVKSNTNGLSIYYSPEIRKGQANQVSADEGQTAVLTCETTGHPEQVISWYAANGNEILTDNRTTVEIVNLGSGELNGTSLNGILSISDIVPEDYGNYRCNASNDVGWNEHVISLGGRAIPDIPRNVVVPSDNVTSSSLWVEWEAGYNGGIIQWFLIQYHEEGSANLEKAHNFTESKRQNYYSREIKDLSPGTPYLIYVSSGNSIGDNFERIKPQQVLTKSAAELNQPGRSNELIVGASVAGVILIVIIIALSAYLLKKPKSKKDDLNHQLRQSPENNQYATTSLDNVNESTDENAAPVYAEVNKNKKASANGNTKENAAPVYAEVNKNKKASANGNTKEPAGNQVSGYANETFKTEEEAYDDVANVTSTTSDGDGRMVNPEGLIYQEVGHFKSHPKDAPPIQTEESTEYASLDFNRMTVK